MTASAVSVRPVMNPEVRITQRDSELSKALAGHVFLDSEAAMVAILAALSSPATVYVKVSLVGAAGAVHRE